MTIKISILKNSDVLIKIEYSRRKDFYKAERLYSSMRQSELNVSPLKDNFDYDCLKVIHHYLFYWAGKARTVAIASYESVNGDNIKLY